jgi:hypothetical protein
VLVRLRLLKTGLWKAIIGAAIAGSVRKNPLLEVTPTCQPAR